jgi:hypothetical protein
MNVRVGTTAAVVLAIALAACGAPSAETGDGVATLSNSGSQPQQTESGDRLTQDEAVQAYNKCVADEGMPELAMAEEDMMAGDGGGIVSVEVDEGDLDASGGSVGAPDDAGGVFDESTFDFGKFEEVDEKCGHYLESAFGEFTLSPEQEAIMKDAELAFTKCMKDHGLDVTILGMGANGESLDPDEPGDSADPNLSMQNAADDDFEKFNEAAQACEHVFLDAEKMLDDAEGGQ